LTFELTLREPLGDRAITATDFPLSIGGTGSAITVRSPAAGPAAWLALHDDQLYVQPAALDGVRVLHNGAQIAGSTWLHNGDVLDVAGGRLRLRIDAGRPLLEVLDGGADNVTAPPVVAVTGSFAGSGAEEDERIDPVAFRRGAEEARTARGKGHRRGART
jgi:hypothetical protein